MLKTLIVLALLFPLNTFAQEFQVMVGIPGVDEGNIDVDAYLNALYILSISIAAVLALLKITIAGVKYVLSDIVTSKEDAKRDIRGAILGLLIVLAAVIILNTVNTSLTNLAFLESGEGEDNRSTFNPIGIVRDEPNAVAVSRLACDALPGRFEQATDADGNLIPNQYLCFPARLNLAQMDRNQVEAMLAAIDEALAELDALGAGSDADMRAALEAQRAELDALRNVTRADGTGGGGGDNTNPGGVCVWTQPTSQVSGDACTGNEFCGTETRTLLCQDQGNNGRSCSCQNI